MSLREALITICLVIMWLLLIIIGIQSSKLAFGEKGAFFFTAEVCALIAVLIVWDLFIGGNRK